jgi:phospholipase D1/2
VDVGIARTQPRYNGDGSVREAELLFLDSIDLAERAIYIENQFLSSALVADRLAQRLRGRPDLEVVIVAPRSHDSWVERHTMRNGRIRFWRRLKEAGGDRVRLVYPSVDQGGHATDTMIHSKIMVVDDRFLRVGSANLNNRSMGADTECDLAIEGKSVTERAAIVDMRNRLLGEHCGVSAGEVAAFLDRHGSIVRAADDLSANGHRLRPIDDGEPDDSGLSDIVERIADPPRPLRPARLARHLLSRLMPSRMVLSLVAAGLVLVGLALAWKYTALSEVAEPRRIGDVLSAGRGEVWAFAVVVTVFVLGGLIMFPLNILVLATAAVFGPWFGLLYSMLGALSSSVLMYFVGARFGKEALGRMLGRRWPKALESVRQRGLLTVVAFRVVPVAPFTLVNLAAGASGIGLADFVLGSVLGWAPGLLLLSFVGDRIVRLVSNPDLAEIGALVLCIVAYVAVAFAAQALLSRWRSRVS